MKVKKSGTLLLNRRGFTENYYRIDYLLGPKKSTQFRGYFSCDQNCNMGTFLRCALYNDTIQPGLVTSRGEPIGKMETKRMELR